MSDKTPDTIDIVVSCFSRDVSELCHAMRRRAACRKVCCYQKCKPDAEYNVPVNKGNEASAYLKYVVDHYDDLPSRVFFCHDEEFSWHHTGSLADRLAEALAGGNAFHNVNSFILGSILSNGLYPSLLQWWDEVVRPHTDAMDRFPRDWTLGHPGCAQFLVHRDRITRHPRALYRDLYAWITSTPLSSAVSGRFMEWTWHVLWGDPPARAVEAREAPAPDPRPARGPRAKHP